MREDAEYLKRLKLERDRERSHRKSRQGRFQSSMISLDSLTAEIDASKSSVFSDKGKGAEAVYAHLDGETPESLYERCKNAARKRIAAKHPSWMDVLDRIFDHGQDRTESICEMTLSGS